MTASIDFEGALADAAGVERGGPGPLQRLSTPPACHTSAAPRLPGEPQPRLVLATVLPGDRRELAVRLVGLTASRLQAAA